MLARLRMFSPLTIWMGAWPRLEQDLPLVSPFRPAMPSSFSPAVWANLLESAHSDIVSYSGRLFSSDTCRRSPFIIDFCWLAGWLASWPAVEGERRHRACERPFVKRPRRRPARGSFRRSSAEPFRSDSRAICLSSLQGHSKLNKNKRGHYN